MLALVAAIGATGVTPLIGPTEGELAMRVSVPNDYPPSPAAAKLQSDLQAAAASGAAAITDAAGDYRFGGASLTLDGAQGDCTSPPRQALRSGSITPRASS